MFISPCAGKLHVHTCMVHVHVHTCASIETVYYVYYKLGMVFPSSSQPREDCVSWKRLLLQVYTPSAMPWRCQEWGVLWPMTSAWRHTGTYAGTMKGLTHMQGGMVQWGGWRTDTSSHYGSCRYKPSHVTPF